MTQDKGVTTTLDLITTTEAATVLGVDRATVSRWSDDKLREPKLVAAGRIGGYKVFRRSDVQALKARIDAERAEASA